MANTPFFPSNSAAAAFSMACTMAGAAEARQLIAELRTGVGGKSAVFNALGGHRDVPGRYELMNGLILQLLFVIDEHYPGGCARALEQVPMEGEGTKVALQFAEAIQSALEVCFRPSEPTGCGGCA